MGEFITRRLCVSWPLAQLAQPAGSSPTAIIAPIAPPFDRRDTILIGNSGYVQARTGTAAAFFACKIGDKEFVTDQSPPRSLARSLEWRWPTGPRQSPRNAMQRCSDGDNGASIQITRSSTIQLLYSTEYSRTQWNGISEATTCKYSLGCAIKCYMFLRLVLNCVNASSIYSSF